MESSGRGEVRRWSAGGGVLQRSGGWTDGPGEVVNQYGQGGKIRYETPCHGVALVRQQSEWLSGIIKRINSDRMRVLFITFPLCTVWVGGDVSVGVCLRSAKKKYLEKIIM